MKKRIISLILLLILLSSCSNTNKIEELEQKLELLNNDIISFSNENEELKEKLEEYEYYNSLYIDEDVELVKYKCTWIKTAIFTYSWMWREEVITNFVDSKDEIIITPKEDYVEFQSKAVDYEVEKYNKIIDDAGTLQFWDWVYDNVRFTIDKTYWHWLWTKHFVRWAFWDTPYWLMTFLKCEEIY